jgi:hypothetical protein
MADYIRFEIYVPRSYTTSSPSDFSRLRGILANVYSDSDSAHRIVHDAGINEQHVAFSPIALNTWHAILREAKNANRIPQLRGVTLGEYPENQSLREAWNAYIGSINGHSVHQIAPEAIEEFINETITRYRGITQAIPTAIPPYKGFWQEGRLSITVDDLTHLFGLIRVNELEEATIYFTMWKKRLQGDTNQDIVLVIYYPVQTKLPTPPQLQ